MATPTSDSYAAASGATIYGGRFAPVVLPAWLAGKALNEWFPISGVGWNTSGYGGSSIDPWGAWADTPAGLLVIPAAGGHHDSSDNRVTSLDLKADAPTWTLRHAASAGGDVVIDQAYYLDGLPSSRHLYGQAHWSAVRNRVMTLGAQFVWGNGYGLPNVDGFSLDTNTWDAAGTYPNSIAGWYGEVLDANGDGWAFLTPALGARKWTASTGVWSDPGVTVPAGWARSPWVLNTSDGSLFGCCWNDNRAGGSLAAPLAINAARFNVGSNTMTQITFNASAAKTQFETDQPDYAGMVYDSANNRFLFYSGKGASAGRVYIITPNGTSVWDISLFNFGAGSTPPGATVNAGLNGRISFIPSLGVVVCAPGASSNLYAFKVA
ncbi:MAG: hypothetical protein V4724_26585 [Pseudomonadota bacterium]